MIDTKTHPTEIEIADFLDKGLAAEERVRMEEHIAICGECLEKIVSAYESIELFRKKSSKQKGKAKFMKKINPYLILAIICFILSFITPRFFLQLLVATLLLGIKWIVDSKSTRMLIMIYEAWKKGGEKEASRILETLQLESKRRF